MKKIFYGLFIGTILNVAYFGWEFQEYIYYFFEPCQQCNNKEIRDCEFCEDGYQIEYGKNCINGKIAIECEDCVNEKCTKCNGIQESIEDFLSKVPSIDLVFANAGLGLLDFVEKGDPSVMNDMINTNVIGVNNTVVPFIPKMLDLYIYLNALQL